MNYKTVFSFIFLLLYVSCTHSPKSEMFIHDEVEWNYLIFMAADNNLERFAINNIRALQSVGSSENVNIIVILDRSPSYDRTEGNWSGTKLLLISNNPKSMSDDVVFDYGELDMTASVCLYDFLKTVNKYFPSRHTVLDVWSHGRGVYPDGIISKGVIEDYTTGYGAANTMSIIDFASAIEKYEIESNKKIDIIQFDACDMQMIEVVYQLKDLADYVIGAETQIPGSGSDYKSIAEYLKIQSNISSEDFSKYISNSFYEYQKDSPTDFSCCVVKTDKLNNFVAELNLLCDNIFLLNADILNEIIIKRHELLQTDGGYPEFCDLFEFLNSLQLIDIDTSVIIQKFLESIIEANAIGVYVDKTKGLGINIPYDDEQFSYYIKPESKYENFDFYNDSRFDELLQKLCSCITE